MSMSTAQRVSFNFDIFREAGGPFRAFDRTFTVHHPGQTS